MFLERDEEGRGRKQEESVTSWIPGRAYVHVIGALALVLICLC